MSERYYWQLRQRDDGSVGTALHAFPVQRDNRREPSRWQPLCGKGEHPPHFTIDSAGMRDGEPLPEPSRCCAKCWRLASRK